ncbi:MAG: ABC transporter ATP-binding protein [Myxococcota bacterium]
MSAVVAELVGLRKAYGERTVLSGVDLTVYEGECVGLLGPNGAGKTTTMKLITGQAHLDSGHIRVFGLDLPRFGREARARLGVVTQDDTLDEELNCIRNLTVQAQMFRLPGPESRRRAHELLAFVQLSDREQAKVTSLSGGMRQRLHIARALMNEPKLLLLDEPTTGLDPQARQNIWQKIRALKRQGTTILLTTHYMDEAEQLCDRLIILDRGEVISHGAPRELIEQTVGREVVEIRTPEGPNGLEGLAARLGRGSWELEVFSDTLFVFLRDDAALPEWLWNTSGLERVQRRATLEDVFLRRTGRELRDL